MGLMDYLLPGMGGGGSNNNTDYVQSKEQKAMYNLMLPWMQKIFSGDTYDVGQAPTYSGYDIPDTKSMMPTEGWWEGMDKDVKAGIMAPYQEGSKQLAEQLMSYGQASQTGGASGSMAAGLGSYWSDSSAAMAKEAWDMVSPAYQAGWEAQLGLNKTKADYGWQGDLAEWQANLNKEQLPYSVASSMMGGTYSTPIVSQPWYTSLLQGAGQMGAAYGLSKIPMGN